MIKFFIRHKFSPQNNRKTYLKKIRRFTAAVFIFIGLILGEASKRYVTWSVPAVLPSGQENRIQEEPPGDKKQDGVSFPELQTEEHSDFLKEENFPENEKNGNRPELSPERLNLAYDYPEGADTEDVLNSYAGRIFRELMNLEVNALADLYELAAVKPADMAIDLGQDPGTVMGGYNPKDDTHIQSDPDTWTINNWKKVHISFVDGNGRTRSDFSNIKEILAMASVYAYYIDPEDTEIFEDYAKQLWKLSHTHTVSMGERYYCDGCMDETEEETDEEMSREIPAASEEMNLASASSLLSGAINRSVNILLSDENTGDGDIEYQDSAGQSDTETAFPEEEGQEHTNCPGHLDLYIRVRVLGLEGKNSLFSKDATGNQIDASPESTWDGWTEKNRSFVNTICSQNYFDDYGIDLSDISVNTALSSDEIGAYMEKLPDDLSEDRKKIIRFALSSVGKVPYYWGGRASYPGYEGNRFGSLVPSDQKGRVLKGLDCSGWVNWVYRSAAGIDMGGASTSGLIHCGEGIRRSELKPGDLIIHTGDDAHVVMFLSWASNGKMNVIHESSAADNNVAITTMDAPWPYYRKILE